MSDKIQLRRGYRTERLALDVAEAVNNGLRVLVCCGSEESAKRYAELIKAKGARFEAVLTGTNLEYGTRLSGKRTEGITEHE